jgi:predicted AlkP superfamily phosphohydrolase/phosphomutase
MSWHVHDETSPFHDPAVRAELGDPVEQIYTRIDQAIGRLMDAFPADGAVFLYVGTGMGPNYTATHMLDEILASFERTDNRSRRLLLKTLKKAWHKVPVRYRGRLRKMGRRVEENIVHGERERRPYFSLPHNDISGAIRINMKGREPQGTIEAGDEYDAVCDMLEENLLALKNLESDAPVVKKVVRVQRDFPGPFAADMPDLFVVWNRPVPINGVKNRRGYTVRHPFTAARTGDHTEAGMLVARLPGGPVGAFEEDVLVTQLGPTVTAAVGVSLDRVDAKPVQRLVDAAPVKRILEPA